MFRSPLGIFNSWAIASYFQTVNSPVNRQFVAAFQHQYGEARVVNDAIASAYTAVYFSPGATPVTGATLPVGANIESARAIAAMGSVVPTGIKICLKPFSKLRNRQILMGSGLLCWNFR